SRLLVAAVTAVLAIVIIAYSRGRSRAHSVRQVMRATLLPPEGARFAPLYRNGPPAISPDGTRIAFVANRDGRTSIWIRALDKLEATELPGTEGGYFPFWSPDGRFLGFSANGKLWRMDRKDGSLIAICNVIEDRGSTWGSNNVILFEPNGQG